MEGYWDDVKKTNEAIDSNGWFHSGYFLALCLFSCLLLSRMKTINTEVFSDFSDVLRIT